MSLAGLAAWLSYSAFFGPRLAPEAPVAPIAQKREATPTAASPIKEVTQEPALAFWVNSKNNSIYYVSSTGQIMKSRDAGKADVASNQELPGFHELIPSSDGSKAIASFYYPYSTIFAVFDTAANTWERLPEGVVAADFDPSGEQIAYIKHGQRPSLSILNLKTRQSREVLPIRYAGGGNLVWKTTNEIYLAGEPSGELPVELWLIDIAKRAIRRVETLASSNMLMLARNAPLGVSLQKSGAYGASLQLVYGNGNIITPLNFKSFPSKCVFAGTMLYCAIPRELPTRVNLPEDYLKEKFYTADTLISYDTETGAEKNLFTDKEPVIDAEQLTVFGNRLLFRNRYDGKIYSIKIEADQR